MDKNLAGEWLRLKNPAVEFLQSTHRRLCQKGMENILPEERNDVQLTALSKVKDMRKV